MTEYGARRIIKFGPDGTILLTIAAPFTPAGLAVAANGMIYVAEYNGGKLHRFAATGEYLGVFATIGGTGTDAVKFDGATFYLSDNKDSLVYRVAVDGTVLAPLTGAPGSAGLALITTGTYAGMIYVGSWAGFGIELVGWYSVLAPDDRAYYGLAVDAAGFLYAAAGGGVWKLPPLDNWQLPPGVLAVSGLRSARDVHVWRAPKAALTLDQLIEDLNVATLALSRIRNSAVATRDAAARNDYIRMCTGVNYFRQNIDSQANNDVLIGPLDELRAAATNIGAALGCR